MKDSIHQFNVVDLAEVKTSRREDISSGLETSTKTMFFRRIWKSIRFLFQYQLRFNSFDCKVKFSENITCFSPTRDNLFILNKRVSREVDRY